MDKHRKGSWLLHDICKISHLLDMEVDVFQPFLYIEARTGFLDPGEVSVTQDFGIGIVGAETLQELYQGLLLGGSTRVGRLAVGIQTALVANADAVGVVTLGMCSNHLLGATRIDGAVLGDVVVVTDRAETLRLVAGFERFYREVAVYSSGRAMDDDKIDFSHGDWD